MQNQYPSAEAIFTKALEFASSVERCAFLAEACAGNEALRHEVESLLAAHEQVGTFLNQPPTEITQAMNGVDPKGSLSEQPGACVGRFKLLERIGEGGFGTVWLAEQTQAHLSWSDPPDLSWVELRFSPNGHYIATRSGMRSLHIWDMAARKLLGKPVRDPIGNLVTDFYLAISPDWKWALAPNGLLNFSDPRHPHAMANLTLSQAAQSARMADFSSNDRLLAMVLPDNTVRLWDITTGRSWGQITATANSANPKFTSIADLTFSPDSRLLFIVTMEIGRDGEYAGNTRLWETATGQPCGLPLSFTGMCNRLWVDPKLRFVGVSLINPHNPSSPHSVQIWKLPAHETPWAEMQQGTWLIAGSRLDTAGNLEAIPPTEWQQLKTAASK